MLDQITPLVLTFDEAPNIGRTLAALGWARRVVVVDSGSTDETTEILRRHPQVETVHHAFTDPTSQWNFALTQVSTPWVLSLDADYQLSDALVSEIATLAPTTEVGGYSAGFVYRIHGRPLRRSLYPPRTVLFRRQGAWHRQDGHTQRLMVAGRVLPLDGIIYHDDRKPLARWLGSQQRYARAEADHLLGRDTAPLSWRDRVRRLGWPAPVAVFAYVLFCQGCLLDGWAGWYYALQRAIAEGLIALELLERRLGKAPATAPDIGEGPRDAA